MKSKFLLTLAGIAVLLTGCSKEEIGSTDSNPITKKSFTVNASNGTQTRANATDLTRYIMEVYEGTTATGTPAIHKEQATGTFENVILKDKQVYTILFWADYGTPSTDGTHLAANEYNASDLKAARVADGKQATRTAFAGVSKFTVGTDDETVYTAVKLTHATAQVNFKQTEAFTSDANTLVVKYPESYSLNVEDMSVTKIAGEVSHSFTYNSKDAGTLGVSYIIAATGTTKTVMDITTTMTSGGKVNSNTSTSTPFERNYRTNLSGAYSNFYNSTLSVTCNDQWATTSKEVIFPIAHIGDYFYSDKTYSTNLNTSKTVIGIVFWVDPADPTKGKVVSLDESATMVWSTEKDAFIGTLTEYYNGAANTAATVSYSGYTPEKYPAVAWCLNKNNPSQAEIKWYLPTQGELVQLSGNPVGSVSNIIKNKLNNVSGATTLSGDYWTSYEKNSSQYVAVTGYNFDQGFPAGYPKNSLKKARAVLAF